MNVMPSTVIPHPTSYRHLRTRFEPQYGALWLFLDPKPRPCFSFEVLSELHDLLGAVGRQTVPGVEPGSMRYFIVASKTPGVFNLGGDLALFARCVADRDEESLRRYAVACIDALFPYIAAFELPVTTISLVQGDAMGGGLEVALSADILIAERRSHLGFPEVLFNLFPGMGAYNLLNRRIGMRRTEQMLLNGKIYRAEEFHAEGLIDILADDGRGENAVYEFIVRNAGRWNAHEGVRRVRRRLHAIRYEHLLEVTEIWVEAAMRVGAREVRLMERLAKSQERFAGKDPSPVVPLGPRGA